MNTTLDIKGPTKMTMVRTNLTSIIIKIQGDTYDAAKHSTYHSKNGNRSTYRFFLQVLKLFIKINQHDSRAGVAKLMLEDARVREVYILYITKKCFGLTIILDQKYFGLKFLAGTKSSRSDTFTLLTCCIVCLLVSLSPYFSSCQFCTFTPLPHAPFHLCTFATLHL